MSPLIGTMTCCCWAVIGLTKQFRSQDIPYKPQIRRSLRIR